MLLTLPAWLGACDAADVSKDLSWEACLELEDPEAECPSVEEAADELDLDPDSELSDRWPERRYTGDDGELYVLPAECCYTLTVPAEASAQRGCR